jgi:tetratricopeptide (TPR) repeat protein
MRLVWSLIGLLLVAVPVWAQATTTPVPVVVAPVATPTIIPLSDIPAILPSDSYIDGMGMVWQDLNRCSAAAFTIQLTAYTEFTDQYHDVMVRLNPNIEDVSVRVEEMIEVANEYGLKGVVRRGGTIDMMKRLIASGFPVLIENAYYEGGGGFKDWMSHNRVLVGYDDAAGVFLIKDSLLGNGDDKKGIRMKYEDVDNRWRDFNRDYLVLYRPDQEANVQSILGPHWDPVFNAQWVLQQADEDEAAGRTDSFTTYNRGWAYLQLGRYDEAATTFDQAMATGLPWRFFWYDFSVFEAFLKVGRYDDALLLAQRTLANTKGAEEIYYYAALAYLGQGNTDRAKANLEAALYRNPYYTDAKNKLAELTGGTTTTTGG